MKKPYKFLRGDCLKRLKELRDNSVDSVVTDAPYGLSKEPDIYEVLSHWLKGDDYSHSHSGFMGKKWDSFVPGPAIWKECFRVLKPGGHLLCFAGSRTDDLMGISVRMGGFEIRDKIMWVYGSGFPKSHSVAKATKQRVSFRYGEIRCDCVDSRNGRVVGNDVRRSSGEKTRIQRRSGHETSPDVGHSDVTIEGGSDPASMRWVRKNDPAKAPRSKAIQEAVLLEDVRECRPKEAGQRNATLRSGLEKSSRRDSDSRQSVSMLRENSETERQCPSRPSSETVSIRGNESPVEPSGVVRRVSSSNRSDHYAGVGFDSDRREARRVVVDDNGGRQEAVARVCSWCGYPDREWIEILEPLGTALKPAFEPIIVARKPIEGTVAANVLKHGTGGINIDGCRVPVTDPAYAKNCSADRGHENNRKRNIEFKMGCGTASALGRFPANLIHDGSVEVEAAFAAFGVTKSGAMKRTVEAYEGDSTTGFLRGRSGPQNQHGDSGSVSRFFYCAKASKKDRNEGLPKGVTNKHATVKPQALMCYLVRLVTPPKGKCLDPFAGSGSTGVAAISEGFRFIGIELEDESYETMKLRVKAAAKKNDPSGFFKS